MWWTSCVYLSGEKLRSFGTYGSGQGQFLSPSGVAVDGEGNIMVVDNRNHRAQKFSVEARWSMVVSGWGTAPEQLLFPLTLRSMAAIRNSMWWMQLVLAFES